MPKQKIAILAGIVVLVGGVAFFATGQDTASFGFKCPEEYRSQDEYVMETARLASEYIKEYPEASQEEILSARQAMFDARGCKGWEAASWYEEEPFLNGEVKPLYFVSYGAGSTTVKCTAAKSIDWDIAIVALSDYMEYGLGSTTGEDHGPAEIQRHFEENCEQDMAIYTDVVTKNPQLLQHKK